MNHDERNPLSPHYRGRDPAPRETESIVGSLVLLAIAGIAQLIGGLIVLTIVYGVALLIFRHAFGVELPNPFNWIR